MEEPTAVFDLSKNHWGSPIGEHRRSYILQALQGAAKISPKADCHFLRNRL